MQKLFRNLLAVSAMAVISSAPTLADDADALSGKWSLKKANDQGQTSTRTLEIKKNKFTFSILSSDDKVILYAEGDLKLEKLGPFNGIKFYNIKAGLSASETQAVDEERASIYQFGEGTLTVASDFDADRGQKPSLDV